jgi:hypothetical protein
VRLVLLIDVDTVEREVETKPAENEGENGWKIEGYIAELSAETAGKRYKATRWLSGFDALTHLVILSPGNCSISLV